MPTADMFHDQAFVVAVILFLGASARSFFGFGDAAVAMPLLTLLSVRVETAVPLVGAAGLVVALGSLLDGWQDMDRAVLKQLAIATVVGIPFGLLLVTVAPEKLVVRSLGVLLVAYGTFSLVGPALPPLRRPGWALAFGFLAGCLGSAYNFNGVPVAVYGSMRQWPAQRFRATLQAHFVVSSALVVAGQAFGGLWTPEMTRLLVLGLPAVLLGVPVGTLLQRRIPSARFAAYAHTMIVLLGLLLLL